MKLNQVAHDRQAQAQAAVLARDRRILLAETVEHVRQEPGLDADAAVGDLDHGVLARAREPHPDRAARRRELDGVGQQVPHTLLQAARVGA